METPVWISRDDGPASNEDGKESDPRTSIRRHALVLFPLLWGLGFLLSRWQTRDTDLALSKATVYALSAFVGFLAYHLICRPRNLLHGPWCIAWGANPAILGPTIAPWPFREMLAFGLTCSLCFAVMIGLIFRFSPFHQFLASEKAGKVPTRSGAHPLADDQIG